MGSAWHCDKGGGNKEGLGRWVRPFVLNKTPPKSGTNNPVSDLMMTEVEDTVFNRINFVSVHRHLGRGGGVGGGTVLKFILQ